MLAQEIRNNLMPVGNNGLMLPKPTMLVNKSLKSGKKQIPGGEKKRLRANFSSLGMVMPFQPSMWDDKTTESVWENSLKNLERKMKEAYSDDVINNLVYRLKKLFARLNFNTHRKSLAIILTPDDEKIMYLDFPVRPVTFFSKKISALELAANLHQETSFFYLVLGKNKSELYDFSRGQFRMVYEEADKPDFSMTARNITNIIYTLNSVTGKPVFVTGIPNLVELFCKSDNATRLYCPLFYGSFPFDRKIRESVVREATTHWKHWHAQSIKGKILFARHANRIISNAEPVLQALVKGMDGVLLIGKKLKRQLQKPISGDIAFEIAADLNSQIEMFLTRGNKVEIIETGLLKGLGGIALLPMFRSAPHRAPGKIITGQLF
jgi:hypothetical protein